MPVTREDMRVVERVASRFVRWEADSERDDLISDGMFVLESAVKDWEGRRWLRDKWQGDRRNFLAGRAKRGMIDGIRQRNGRSNGDYPKQRFREKILSLDATVQTLGSGPGRWNVSMLDQFVGELDRDLEDVGVLEMLDALPVREREVIQRSVLEGETELSIARDFGVSYSRISQIRSQGLSRLRGEIPMPSSSPLSSREVAVLQLVANDKTNTEIAVQLLISEETVKTHMRHVHRKLGVKHRAGAVAYGFRHGLLR